MVTHGRRLGFLVTVVAFACTAKVIPNADDQEAVPSPTAQVVAVDPGPTPVDGRTPALIREQGNHLVDEPSPYLQQHAHNPVDWYPWGPEALERARRENKPIFLSIGYSTCHWCHVMEHESFEDDDVAAFLNAYFVAIKVDREQRPDIDAIYIKAVAAMGGSTGWPLSVFLTPQRQPYFGGTYFPRHARAGRPGFLEVLEQTRQMYATEGEAMGERGDELLRKVERQALAAVGAPAPLDGARLAAGLSRLVPARDLTYGGMGRRNKFPQSPLLLAQLRNVARQGDDPTPGDREHLVRTLDAIMHGGIRDHLAGSFHRYTVDTHWHLPHFEKTLYDNAQLAAIYLEAGRTLGRDDYTRVGVAVLDDLVEHWQQPDGGFVVGFDADDPGGEGYYYSWTPKELAAVLPEADARVIEVAFGVDEAGDREIGGRSVLHRQDDHQTAATLSSTVPQVRAAIDRSLPLLAAARAQRRPPSTDDKELVAWNGLAIMALADAARWLDEPRYAQAASRAGAWILDTAWTTAPLRRGVRQGQSLGPGFLDDHALAGLALVRLHAATGELRWLTGARRLADTILADFYDADGHVFLHTRVADADDPAALPLRLATFDDNAIPSGGSAAVWLMLELGAITGDEALYGVGHDVLSRALPQASQRPFSSGWMLGALDHATSRPREVVIAGDAADPLTAGLWAEVAPSAHARILPVRLPAAGAPAALEERFGALTGKRARDGKATAYVCERGRCEAPTSDPKRLREQLLASPG